MKQLTAQIAALYLGCECVTKYSGWKHWEHPTTLNWTKLRNMEGGLGFEIKPCLRPISSMTEEGKERTLETNILFKGELQHVQ